MGRAGDGKFDGHGREFLSCCANNDLKVYFIQLFFVDDGTVPLDFGTHDNEDPDHAADEPSSSEPSDSESEGESSSSRSRPPSLQTQPKAKVTPLISKSRKPSAWTDPSDTPTVTISTAAPRLQKLRDAPDETILSGREYESRLRRQYERIHPQPEWAKKAKGRRRAATTASVASDEDDEEGGSMQDLLSSTTGILAVREKMRGGTAVLPAGTLAIERLRDANQAAQGSGSGEVKVVAFHPSDKIPVLCVGTADRRVRLFNVSILWSFEPFPSLHFDVYMSSFVVLFSSLWEYYD